VDVPENNFVQTGPHALAGRYLRRFWQPVWVARELEPGRAWPIRVMGDDFTLYRGRSGTPYVVQYRCPHRGTQLSTGHVVGDEIECHYHGWRFNSAGACTAQPAELRPFCDKVGIATYPTKEAMGLIFAYFGAPPAPPLPVWPDLTVADRHRMDCNYFQSAENIVDDVHVHFSHRTGANAASPFKGVPRVSAEERDFGLSQYLFHENDRVKQIHFLMPNSCHLVTGFTATLGKKFVFWYVPIDDTSHNHFMATDSVDPYRRSPVPLDVPPALRDDWFSRTTREILEGRRHLNEFAPAHQYFRLQDTVMAVGQGPICDRSSERLGTSDAAVILLRKIWRRELRRLQGGEALTAFAPPATLEACEGHPPPDAKVAKSRGAPEAPQS
jgi:5,5'-dehydrodivanillate O-demethylase oxygenase subunit